MKIRFLELNDKMADSWSESYDVIFSVLRQHANTDKPVLVDGRDWALLEELEGTTDYDLVYSKVYAAKVAHLVKNVECIALYCLVRDGEGEGLEVLVDQDSSLTYHIRHIPQEAIIALAESKKLLHS